MRRKKICIEDEGLWCTDGVSVFDIKRINGAQDAGLCFKKYKNFMAVIW